LTKEVKMAQFTELQVQTALKVGPQALADGSLITARGMKDGSAVVAQAHPRLTEAGIRKRLFYNYAPAVAMSLPHATNLGNIVWNPPDSGVLLSLVGWSLAVLVTDADALSFQLCYSVQTTIPTTASGSTCGPCYFSAVGSGAGMAKGWGIATVSTAPTPVWMLCHTTVAIAVTGVDQLSGSFEGAWIVPPGYIVTINSIAAAAASGITSCLMWEEIPIV
jgi:hypothetical protein